MCTAVFVSSKVELCRSLAVLQPQKPRVRQPNLGMSTRVRVVTLSIGNEWGVRSVFSGSGIICCAIDRDGYSAKPKITAVIKLHCLLGFLQLCLSGLCMFQVASTGTSIPAHWLVGFVMVSHTALHSVCRYRREMV